MGARFAILVALTAAGLTAAELPYAGKWRLNPAKSDFGENTVTYEQIVGGEMKVTAEGQSYKFKMDGKEYPTPWGTTDTWKSIDAHAWEVTFKVNGKVTGTETLRLSADGKTLTADVKTMKADGGVSDASTVFQRLSGGPGLAGKWKTRNVKISSPSVIDLAASGSDGLILKFPDEGGACDARFDGKDYPATGSMWPSGWTCAVTQNGARGFDAAWKKDGKLMFKDAFTVSADGKTLTEVGSFPGSAEKIKAVYERQ